MGCKKAQGFLDANHVTVRDRADAKKERRGREQALAIARQVDRVIVARGKKMIEFDMKKDPPDDSILASHLLGPTGNLRAPTIRRGRTLLVGFGNEAYQELLISAPK